MNANATMSNCHQIRWTLDVSLAGKIDENNRIYVWAGGPIVDSHVKVIHERKDGKVDRRSAGVRVCGRCGETGHNKRTCRNAAVATAPVAVKAPSGRKCGKCNGTGHNARTCGKKSK